VQSYSTNLPISDIGLVCGFGQAKFPDGGLALGSSQFTMLPQLHQKNDARFKRCQN